jgi:HEAT repeat protein
MSINRSARGAAQTAWISLFLSLLAVSLVLSSCSSESGIASRIESLAIQPRGQSDSDPYKSHERYVNQLVEIGEPAVEPLIQALENPKNEIQRNYVARALGRIGDPRAIEPLFREIRRNPENAGAVLEALIALAPDDPRTVEAAMKGAGEGGFYAQVAQAYLKSRGDTEAFIDLEALASTKGSARRRAVETLLGYGDVQAAEALGGLLKSDDPGEIQIGLDTLMFILTDGDNDVDLSKAELSQQALAVLNLNTEDLIALIDRPEEDIYLLAARLLAVATTPDAIDEWFDILENDTKDLKTFFLGSLVGLDDPRAEAALWNAILYYEFPGMTESFLLRDIRETGEFPLDIILPALEDANEDVRRSAIAALGMSGDTEALPHLGKVLTGRSESQKLRLEAADALGKSGLDSAVPILADALDDPDESIQQGAVAGIVQIGGDRAIATLKKTCQAGESAVFWSSCVYLASLQPGQVADLLKAIPQEDTTLIASAYPFFIAWGEEDSEGVLIEALNQYGTKAMAQAYINSGNEKLEEAGRAWAKAQGYIVLPQPGGGGARWGGGR